MKYFVNVIILAWFPLGVKGDNCDTIVAYLSHSGNDFLSPLLYYYRPYRSYRNILNTNFFYVYRIGTRNFKGRRCLMRSKVRMFLQKEKQRNGMFDSFVHKWEYYRILIVSYRIAIIVSQLLQLSPLSPSGNQALRSFESSN